MNQKFDTADMRKICRHKIQAISAWVFVLTLAVAPNVLAQGRAIKSFQVQDMDFGSFVAIASSGAIVLSPTGNATYNGVLNTGGAVLTAGFEIRGVKFDTFLIDLPVEVVIPGGASGDMIIDNFTSEPAGVGTFNAQGKAYVSVGATMHMTNQLAAGLYTNSFDITFTYEFLP